MKVHELIEELKKLPLSAEVRMRFNAPHLYGGCEVHSIERVDLSVWRGDFPTKRTVYLDYTY